MMCSCIDQSAKNVSDMEINKIRFEHKQKIQELKIKLDQKDVKIKELKDKCSKYYHAVVKLRNKLAKYVDESDKNTNSSGYAETPLWWQIP